MIRIDLLPVGKITAYDMPNAQTLTSRGLKPATNSSFFRDQKNMQMMLLNEFVISEIQKIIKDHKEKNIIIGIRENFSEIGIIIE